MNDADIEMHNLTEIANRESRLAKMGICCHGWRQGGNATNGIPMGKTKCLECGILSTDEQLEAERQDRLS